MLYTLFDSSGKGLSLFWVEGPALMPDGCLMGSGAEASNVPLQLVSICSTVDTSMGCSPEPPADSRDGLPVS
ncbi:hypothetical protein INR49_015046, partial [Caranx melampygus]